MRLILVSAALAVLVCIAAGCADDKRPAAATSSTTSAPQALDVRVVQTIDESAGLYIEGSVPYIAVATPDGEELLRARLEFEEDSIETTIRLDPGEYVLTSWQRPCSGNCGYLDPPTDYCTEDIVLSPQEPAQIEIVLRAGEGCTMTLEQ